MSSRRALSSVHRGRHHVTASLSAAVLGSLAWVAAGCSGSEAAPPSTATTVAVLQAPVTETTFCEQMTKIRVEAMQSDGPVDRDVLIVEYETALSVAPAEVQPDLEDLISSLQSDAPSSTETVEVDSGDAEGEGWQPAPDPAGRVFDYVDIYCLGTASNPGPAATPPP